ncbi:MAG: hypothetical protein RJA99_2376 [Pseudomonadota bacterium]|jgi:hypothetical protein
MSTFGRRFNLRARTAALVLGAAVGALAHAEDGTGRHTVQDVRVTAGTPNPGLAVGDVIFTSVTARPFREVAAATDSWTNHVGIVLAIDGDEPLIGESTFPFSRTTSLSKFVARSRNGRYAVARLKTDLTSDERQRVVIAAERRTGVLYDTGFDLHSRRQFCSRYVREVLAEATGVDVGEVQTFADLLKQQPGASLGFWKLWYFGRIPWERATVTPASLLRSPALQIIFDSAASVPAARPA